MRVSFHSDVQQGECSEGCSFPTSHPYDAIRAHARVEISKPEFRMFVELSAGPQPRLNRELFRQRDEK